MHHKHRRIATVLNSVWLGTRANAANFTNNVCIFTGMISSVFHTSMHFILMGANMFPYVFAIRNALYYLGWCMVVGTCANAETCTDAVGTFSYIFKSVLDTSMRFQALNELGLSFFIYHE